MAQLLLLVNAFLYQRSSVDIGVICIWARIITMASTFSTTTISQTKTTVSVDWSMALSYTVCCVCWTIAIQLGQTEKNQFSLRQDFTLPYFTHWLSEFLCQWWLKIAVAAALINCSSSPVQFKLICQTVCSLEVRERSTFGGREKEKANSLARQ